MSTQEDRWRGNAEGYPGSRGQSIFYGGQDDILLSGDVDVLVVFLWRLFSSTSLPRASRFLVLFFSKGKQLLRHQ